LPEILPEDVDPAEVQLLCCGPSPMLRALAKYSAARGFECWTSLESPMACGLGICFSCVVDWKTDDGTWDYKRTCVDGPVFDASRLRWD
jgi:dihydroorotate dehydrogenase electron transfer subunit